MDYIKFIVDGITHTCKNFKKRSAGSKSCKDAQLDMADQLKDAVDETRIQKFDVRPHAFVGSIPLVEILNIIGAAAFVVGIIVKIHWLCLLTIILTALSFVVFIAEFVFYTETTDFMYPKREGQNVFMVRKAKEKTKRRIIICGHADAAFEMPPMSKYPRVLTYIIIGSGVLLLFINIIFSNLVLADFLNELTYQIFAYIIIGFSALSLPLLFFVDWKTIVDGANDDLTGCYTAMSFIREMADNDFRFKNTDVCCLITDGEEAGLRGARAFAKEYVEELLDINTIVIAVDTIRELKELRIFARGINYTESNSEDACNLIKFAGLKRGYDIPSAEFYPGACDSEAFSVIGVKSVGVCAVSFQPADYYHTATDTYTNLDPNTIKEVREILKDAIEMFDKAGNIF